MRNTFVDIFEQFKLIDAFRTSFKDDFKASFAPLVAEYQAVDDQEQLDDFLDQMAEEAISFTESVIEKDRSYSDYRKTEELKVMTSLQERLNYDKLSQQQLAQSKHLLNDLILTHYPALYELTSFGYRLLDRNINYYTWRFLVNIQNEIQ